ncbi:phosphotransferase [Ekhidna sp.]|uniref:phosphotransferase n=1 Tax=Ekhidna sp. TaxID=2608089 RepID=UPI003B504A16
MEEKLADIVCEKMNASFITKIETIQTLWSGYGEIKRCHLEEGQSSSVIIKHIQFPGHSNHPKGWNTSLSHQRKLKSYEVERIWYNEYISISDNHCKIPHCHYAASIDGGVLIILEDLNASGFVLRITPDSITLNHAKSCLSWLANFHARFLGIEPNGLWETGTYWHLKTRPDELSRMQNIPLKNVADSIDDKLNTASYQTIVHGDAKLANFCFSKNERVAAVDFQYVGKGCGMKDVAYFISSCFKEDQCEKYEVELLNHYFSVLERGLDDSVNFRLLKEEWYDLYKYAWADFYRFLDGWSPNHWKMHDYSLKLTNQVIQEMKTQ